METFGRRSRPFSKTLADSRSLPEPPALHAEQSSSAPASWRSRSPFPLPPARPPAVGESHGALSVRRVLRRRVAEVARLVPLSSVSSETLREFATPFLQYTSFSPSDERRNYVAAVSERPASSAKRLPSARSLALPPRLFPSTGAAPDTPSRQ